MEKSKHCWPYEPRKKYTSFTLYLKVGVVV